MADTLAPIAQNIAGWHVSPEEIVRRRALNAELIELTQPHLEWLSRAHLDVPHVASLVDREGVILFSTGKQHDVMRTIKLPGMGAPVQAPDGATIAAIKLSVGTDGDSMPRLLLVAHIAFAVEQELRHRALCRQAALPDDAARTVRPAA
jgi:transcriptional regulator of acetoin/glycerol metabolism